MNEIQQSFQQFQGIPYPFNATAGLGAGPLTGIGGSFDYNAGYGRGYHDGYEKGLNESKRCCQHCPAATNQDFAHVGDT